MEYGFVIDPCWGFFGISSVCCVFLARLVELGGAGGGAWEAKCSDDSMGLEPKKVEVYEWDRPPTIALG